MREPDEGPEWVTRAQFAAALQVHVGTVSRWIRDDPDMQVKRLGPQGHRVRIHRSEIARRTSGHLPTEDSPAAS